ncbi:hypothetical protein B0H19DRAFT_1068060 [Mycena capillaripes]|nr:hypothetical protein B0H19DRAFT_1068060 [Mycena capillaripes]
MYALKLKTNQHLGAGGASAECFEIVEMQSVVWTLESAGAAAGCGLICVPGSEVDAGEGEVKGMYYSLSHPFLGCPAGNTTRAKLRSNQNQININTNFRNMFRRHPQAGESIDTIHVSWYYCGNATDSIRTKSERLGQGFISAVHVAPRANFTRGDIIYDWVNYIDQYTPIESGTIPREKFVVSASFLSAMLVAGSRARNVHRRGVHTMAEVKPTSTHLRFNASAHEYTWSYSDDTPMHRQVSAGGGLLKSGRRELFPSSVELISVPYDLLGGIWRVRRACIEGGEMIVAIRAAVPEGMPASGRRPKADRISSFHCSNLASTASQPHPSNVLTPYENTAFI